MAKKEEKDEQIETQFPELEKVDTSKDTQAQAEFRVIIAKYKEEKPESYERSKEEYERILVKLGNNPEMHFNDIGFTSYENNKVVTG